MQKISKQRLKRLLKREITRLEALYLCDPIDAVEVERSVRIIKAFIDMLIKLEKTEGTKTRNELNIKIDLNESKDE